MNVSRRLWLRLSLRDTILLKLTSYYIHTDVLFFVFRVPGSSHMIKLFKALTLTICFSFLALRALWIESVPGLPIQFFPTGCENFFS